MPHSDFILLIYTGSHDLLNGFHVYLVLGFGKFGIEDQVDLAGAERGDDLKIVGGDLQACDVKCWEVGRINWYTVYLVAGCIHLSCQFGERKLCNGNIFCITY